MQGWNMYKKIQRIYGSLDYPYRFNAGNVYSILATPFQNNLWFHAINIALSN